MIAHPPLEAVYIYFDTATYDEIERDVKVQKLAPPDITMLFLVKTSGDNRGPIGPYRRHDGPSHWLLHPQWG